MGGRAGEDVRGRGQVLQSPKVKMKPKQGSNTIRFTVRVFGLAAVGREGKCPWGMGSEVLKWSRHQMSTQMGPCDLTCVYFGRRRKWNFQEH